MSSIRAQAAKAKSKAVKAKAENAAKAETKKEEKEGDEGDEIVENLKELENIRNPDVVTKYKMAAEISNQALELVKKACKEGATPLELCKFGDSFIKEEISKVFAKNKKLEKGIAFPTSVSVNEVVGHVSPMKGEDAPAMANGDVVKIDLGVHIDGYAAVVASTVVVGGEKPKEKKADVLKAVSTAAECAVRLLKPGNSSTQVSDVLAKVAKQFGVNLVNSIVSHNMSRFVIDGDKIIQNKPGVEGEKREKVITFEENEVYAMDIMMTTGDGSTCESAMRTTVYKRSVDTTYKLKMKASRAIFTDISKEFPTFPFTIRNLDEKKVRFGIVECANHDLVKGYPVMTDTNGEFVAHIKFTVLLMPSGTMRITGAEMDTSGFESEKKVEDEELVKLLATSYGKKKKKNKKKKKKAAE